MKKIIFSIIVAFAMIIGVNATEKNEVTLNFEGGIIHDGYVEYSKVANVQLFKDDTLVVDITNNMVIDLNEAEYEFVIEEIEDKSVVGVNMPIKLMINNWYYPISTSIVEGSKSSFKLESSKFSGTLEVKFLRTSIGINTRVENIYNDISLKGIIDLTETKEYVIDFSKTDELTEGLKSFADLEKTLYYKRVNDGLTITDNENEAVIKIVGDKDKNQAILSAVNVGNKIEESTSGLHTKYTGSKLQYDNSDNGIINETRTDYYTRCKYEIKFVYAKVEDAKEYKFLEGANQEYTINKDNELTFKIDADYNLFNKIYVDGELIDISNYKVTEGSTIVTFNQEYVNKLSVGKHTLKLEFNDGEANTEFSILKEEIKNPSANEKEEITNPSTNDNLDKYIILGFVAVIGVIGCTLILKRKF